MHKLPHGVANQFAYVTHDMEGMIHRWVGSMKAGPFFVMELTDPNDPTIWRRYRGDPAGDTMKICLGFMGHTMLEFIQPTNDAPSTFREFLDTRGEVAQHIFPRIRPHTAEEFDTISGGYVASGYPIVSEARSPVFGRTSFFDAVAEIGVFIELVELTPPAYDVIDLMYRAHMGWDGGRTIRAVSEVMNEVLGGAVG